MVNGSELAARPPGPDPVRRAVHDILARPEFQPAPQSPLDRIRQWVGDQISRVLDAIVGGHRLGMLGLAVTLIVLAALVWLTVRAVRAMGVNPVIDGVPVTGRRRPAADWLAEAVLCAARGDFRGSLRARYRALVAELSARGLVEEVPGRTTGEYRRAVGETLPGAASVFGEATDLFELAWYGHAPMTADDDGRFRSLASQTLTGAR